jgi:putative glutathione S-transferase
MSDSSAARTFSLGREAGADGSFERQRSAFRDWVTTDGSSPHPAEPGRYHLYVSWACPWAHRAIIARRLKGLEHAISMSAVDPWRDERGWGFTPGAYDDPLNGFRFLSQAYERTDPSYDGRHSVPVLWDKRLGRIVSNESGDVVRMLNDAFDAFAERDVDLYPAPLRAEIDALEERIYDTVNNGVYKAGFARSQEVYEREVTALFETLDWLEERLTTRRYLVGHSPTEVDWRLFTTLVRFDSAYHVHFKCNLRRIVDYPNLWAYVRDLYQQPGIAATVRMDEIKRHYFTTHPEIDPIGLVPLGPVLDFTAPHGRERLSLRSAAA